MHKDVYYTNTQNKYTSFFTWTKSILS